MTLSESDTRAKLIDPALHARGWTVTREEIEARGYDLKAVNPNIKPNGDTRTPGDILDVIETKGREVVEALAALRRMR